jgi:flagellar biosynthesis protein FlhG
MSKEELKKYFETLEISPDATILEIRNAYNRLKKLYSTDSVVISPIADEFSKKEREKILQQVEEAFKKLMESLKGQHSSSPSSTGDLDSDDDPSTEETEEESYSGSVLKQIREKMGIQLFEVSLDTKIRMELLESIEQEKYDLLPQEVYLKGHLTNYASYLLLKPKKVTQDYIARYRAWKEGKKEKR